MPSNTLIKQRIVIEKIISTLEKNTTQNLKPIIDKLNHIKNQQEDDNTDSINTLVRQELLNLANHHEVDAALYLLAKFWPINKKSLDKNNKAYFTCPITNTELTKKNTVSTVSGWLYDASLLPDFLVKNALNPQTQKPFTRFEVAYFAEEAKRRGMRPTKKQFSFYGQYVCVGLGVLSYIGFVVAYALGVPAVVTPVAIALSYLNQKIIAFYLLFAVVTSLHTLDAPKANLLLFSPFLLPIAASLFIPLAICAAIGVTIDAIVDLLCNSLHLNKLEPNVTRQELQDEIKKSHKAENQLSSSSYFMNQAFSVVPLPSNYDDNNVIPIQISMSSVTNKNNMLISEALLEAKDLPEENEKSTDVRFAIR